MAFLLNDPARCSRRSTAAWRTATPPAPPRATFASGSRDPQAGFCKTAKFSESCLPYCRSCLVASTIRQRKSRRVLVVAASTEAPSHGSKWRGRAANGRLRAFVKPPILDRGEGHPQAGVRVAPALVAEDHCIKPSSLPLSGVHLFVPASAKLLRDCGGRLGGGVKRLCLAFLGALACAALASCAVGPDYHPPEAPMPANFVPASSISASSDHRSDRAIETAKWWRSLHDRELDSLVDRAIAASPSLEDRTGPAPTGARAGSRCRRRGAARG